LWTNQLRTISRTTIAMKPVMASSRGPSGEAASRTACTTNHVAIVAPNDTAAPAITGRLRPALAPTKLAVIAAKIRTASRPSRKTIIDALKTTVLWLSGAVASVGSTGPVFAVAIR
jgi:hypothetical protein